MDLNDYILISRNGVLYRTKISSLSSILFFKSTRDSLEKDIAAISSYIAESYNVFPDTHYTKSEMKAEFSTISSVNALTANGTYVLTSLAKNKADSLSSINNINTWYRNTLSGNTEVLSEAYRWTSRFVRQDMNKTGKKDGFVKTDMDKSYILAKSEVKI